MSNRPETALDYFRRGFNCAQSVLVAFGDLTCLPEDVALNIAGGYGSGAGTRELCGAVNGAIMTLGALTPIDTADPVGSKRRTMGLAKELQSRFAERFDAVRCRDLLARSADFVPDGRTPVAAKLGLTRHCEIMVATAVELTEEIIGER